MRYVFFEWHGFSKKLYRIATQEDYLRLRDGLLMNPIQGDLIPGLGGARKIRMAIRNQGKRGGARVVYYLNIETEIWFLEVYAKNQKADLSNPDRKSISLKIAAIKDRK